MPFSFMVRLFEYCLTKTLMKHFYDDQNDFKAVFLCACSRASLIPINCILFLQCQQSELCANAMSQLFSSENQSFLQELNSWRRKGTPHFPALGLDTMKSFQTSRKSPVLIYWIHQALLQTMDFEPNTTEIKQKQCDSVGYIQIIEKKWQACRRVRNI